MEGKSMKNKEEQKKDSKDKDKKQPKQEKLVRKIYINILTLNNNSQRKI